MAHLDLVGGGARSADQDDGPPARQPHEGGIKRAGADLRALEVAEQRDRTPDRLRRGAHILGGLPMRGVVAVRKVQAGDIHARLDHRAQDRRRGARWSDGADDSRVPSQNSTRTMRRIISARTS